MNLKRCDNKHFYNGDKFQSCPHCAAIAADTKPTMPYSEMGGSYNTAMTEAVTVSTEAPYSSNQTLSLKDAVSKAVSDPALKTEYLNEWADMKTPDEERTISIYQEKSGIDPVVGWLVCIEGEDFGDSFKIKTGKNFVGRSSGMDIVLRGDKSISRERHAVILYEPRRREFIAQAGGSRELFYLNDEVVLNPVRIKQHDILTIGNTRLMFFPCCGEDFSWEDYRKDGES